MTHKPLTLPALPALPDPEMLVLGPRERALYHVQIAGLMESLAGLCRTAQRPGEVAQVLLETGQSADKLDRQLDDMLCILVLLVQTWQRELRMQAALQAAYPGGH
jgi:hypothetical protein